ncbi:hypothetical protein RJT34_32542 [Clitoria ternatea]|uniref:Receptor-like serine/threonine-protein kinase n=1 Tax=Clitoria ternatea TaxID=43366 RepID=A0AAN9EWB7_CLITE
MAMASTPVVLILLLLMLFAKEATAERNMISLGSTLSPKGKNSSWASSSGRFAFGFYPKGDDGFAVGIWLVSPPDQNTVVWTANRDSPPISSNSTLNLTMKGLQLPQINGEENQYLISDSMISYSTYSRSGPFSRGVAWASMHDSGNFVLYDYNHTVIWQSFDNPTDTMLGGQKLTRGGKLVSSVSKSDHSSGNYYLSMQDDGNLVAYPMQASAEEEDAYWVQTDALGAYPYLSLDISGFLRLGDDFNPDFSHISNPRSKSQDTSSIYRATLDADGNFRLYEHQLVDSGIGTSHVQQRIWQAFLDKCQVKGICGLNSYCYIEKGNAVCECYPGFVPSKGSGGNASRDCIQIHGKDDCESSEDPKMLYNVTRLENMSWGDTPYSVVPTKKETCERSCREDCDCGAVLYSENMNCMKYRLPLIYGRRLQNSSMAALLKMPSGTVFRPTPNNTDVSPRKPKVIVDNKTGLIMILAFTLGFIWLLSVVFAVCTLLTYRRRVYRYTTLSASENLGFPEECSLRSFSFDELVKSTGGFMEEIGKGSFGAVYRGTIGDSNRSVAVKRFERIVDEGVREFRAEITAIARTHHRNLVKLVGFCIDGSKKLLVYEYASNGSLANLLFNGDKRLSLRDKLKIALDVARGILYLHEECEVRIIHCNIKPRNILMDEAWTAKISDFGLARLLKPEYSRMKMEDDGESRYLAPEWQRGALISVKSDVYSFGKVLLEILCRRNSIEMNVSSAEEILLSSWVYQCFAAGQLNRLVKDDEDEGGEWKILERMVKVGLWCVQDQPPLRPSMKNVILMLEGLKDIPNPPSPASPLN